VSMNLGKKYRENSTRASRKAKRSCARCGQRQGALWRSAAATHHIPAARRGVFYIMSPGDYPAMYRTAVRGIFSCWRGFLPEIGLPENASQLCDQPREERLSSPCPAACPPFPRLRCVSPRSEGHDKFFIRVLGGFRGSFCAVPQAGRRKNVSTE